MSLVTDGHWHHIVGVRDKEAGFLRIYVDGSEDAPPEPDVTSVFPEVSNKVNQARNEGKLIHWKELLEDLKDLGELRIVACVQITEILGLKKDDLLPFVDDIAGVNTLAEEVMSADQVISI